MELSEDARGERERQSEFERHLYGAAVKELGPADAERLLLVMKNADVVEHDDLEYYTQHHVIMAIVKDDLGDRYDPLALGSIVDSVRRPTQTETEKAHVACDVAAGGNAQGRETQGRSTSKGAKALGSVAQGTQPQQRCEQGGIKLPQPKVKGTLHEDQWVSSVNKAVAEVEKQYGIKVESYCRSMCSVGQQLLLEKIQQKAQGIYDYRAGKSVYRANRKHKKP